jgi:hypothetical protein
METYRGNGGTVPHILDIALDGGKWSVSFTPRTLYPQGKNPWYPLDRRLGGPQSRSGRGGEKNSQPLPALEPPIFQPVAQRYTTELSRLLVYYQILTFAVCKVTCLLINHIRVYETMWLRLHTEVSEYVSWLQLQPVGLYNDSWQSYRPSFVLDLQHTNMNMTLGRVWIIKM